MTGEAPDIRASRLADEIVRRLDQGVALGRVSVYNVAREVLIEEFTKRMCPYCGALHQHCLHARGDGTFMPPPAVDIP